MFVMVFSDFYALPFLPFHSEVCLPNGTPILILEICNILIFFVE